jgi:hypothetical protein
MYTAKACVSDTLSNTDTIKLDPGSNPERSGGKLATYHLSCIVLQGTYDADSVLPADCKSSDVFVKHSLLQRA